MNYCFNDSFRIGAQHNVEKKKYTNTASILWALSFDWNRSSYPECPESRELLLVKKMPSFTQKNTSGIARCKNKQFVFKAWKLLQQFPEISHKVVHEQARSSGGGGECLPSAFWKSKKVTWFCPSLNQVFHSRFSFKSI